MFGKKKSSRLVVNTLVGEQTRIEGDLRFDGGCHIDGVVSGTVKSGQDTAACLSISEHGRVDGDVHVAHLSLNGTVNGDVYVSTRAELGPTARVIGNVHYKLIEMAAGAEINGKLIHSDSGADGRTQASDKIAEKPLQQVPRSVPLKKTS